MKTFSRIMGQLIIAFAILFVIYQNDHPFSKEIAGSNLQESFGIKVQDNAISSLPFLVVRLQKKETKDYFFNGEFTVTLYNVIGKVVWSGSFGPNYESEKIKIPMQKLPIGLYYIEISGDHFSKVLKVIILNTEGASNEIKI